MKKRNRVIATLIALCVLVVAIGPMNLFDTTDTVEAAYTMNKTYDASEEYFKLQTSPYSYNGYKVTPFTICNDWLSARPDGGAPIGEGMSVVTGENVKQGAKLVIEFKEPINSKEFEVITLTMKQVPGNSYNAYNSTDNILSTVRKSFSFSTYELEKVSFQTALFADSKGYVNAIILQNTKAENGGQLFIDSFSVSASPYEKNIIYDATGDYLAQQSSTSYKGVSVIPFGHRSTFWEKEAQIDSDEGYALFATKYVNNKSENLTKGDTLILEFVNDINAKKFKYINVTFATSTQSGAQLEFYNANDISGGKLGSVKETGKANFWSFNTISLRTSDFADKDGYVNVIAMKFMGDKAESFSVGAFSLSDTPQSLTTTGNSGGGTGITEGLVDTKNQYDGTDKNFVLQNSEEYNGIKILPISEYNDYLSQQTDGGKGMGEGYALFTSRVAKAGDVVVLEFVNPINSEKADLITLSLKHVPGNNWSVYNLSDTKFSNAIKTFEIGSYSIEKLALRTKFLAGSDGMVRGIMLKLGSCESEGQLFVDGYSLSNDPYKINTTYDMTEDYVKVQSKGLYKGLKTAVFNERTTFWEKEAKRETDTGYSLVAHKEDGSALSKGDILILEFVTDVSAEKFEVMNLTLATSSQKGATFEVYNVNEIVNGTLGEAKQKVTATYWDFEANSLPLASYADENGYVSAIALKLVSDEAATFSAGSFTLVTLASLIEVTEPDILDNKLTVEETDTSYEFSIEFNKTGSIGKKADETTLGDFISINGVKVSQINQDKKYVKISWQTVGRYYLNISVDKSYAGEGAIINADKLLVGNYIDIDQSLKMPNEDGLSHAYRLHVYSGDNITEVKEERNYSPITVNRMVSGIDANGDLKIDVYFNNHITGTNLYFVCNPDSWSKKNLIPLNSTMTTYYDEQIMESFIFGGYKSSLLDNLLINDCSIGEWLAIDELAGSATYNSAIMVHYGMVGNKTATIFIAANSQIGMELIEEYEANNLRLTFDEGLQFANGKEIKESITFAYADDVWETENTQTTDEQSETVKVVPPDNENVLAIVSGVACGVILISAVILIVINARRKKNENESNK